MAKEVAVFCEFFAKKLQFLMHKNRKKRVKIKQTEIVLVQNA